VLAFQDDQWLAKGEVFQHQAALRTKNAKNGSEPEPRQGKHGSKFIADRLAGCRREVVDFKTGQNCDKGQSCFLY